MSMKNGSLVTMEMGELIVVQKKRKREDGNESEKK